MQGMGVDVCRPADGCERNAGEAGNDETKKARFPFEHRAYVPQVPEIAYMHEPYQLPVIPRNGFQLCDSKGVSHFWQ
jgi:hypothetical protein